MFVMRSPNILSLFLILCVYISWILSKCLRGVEAQKMLGHYTRVVLYSVSLFGFLCNLYIYNKNKYYGKFDLKMFWGGLRDDECIGTLNKRKQVITSRVK